MLGVLSRKLLFTILRVCRLLERIRITGAHVNFAHSGNQVLSPRLGLGTRYIAQILPSHLWMAPRVNGSDCSTACRGENIPHS